MVKLQRTVLSEFSVREAELLYRVANRLDNSVDMVSLLLGVGLKVEGTSLEEVEECRWAVKGWSELHVAVAFDRTDEITRLIKMGSIGRWSVKIEMDGRRCIWRRVKGMRGVLKCWRVLVLMWTLGVMIVVRHCIGRS
ncbi:hypothetical protein HanLR1_Chr17g0682821 [Helianthus annuus]|nr:hypothetical protein HanLR1_Chr17g0682821 [Helianthus annuus]